MIETSFPVETQGREAALVNRFLDLVIEARARYLKLPWADNPSKLQEQQHKARVALWSVFPGARLCVWKDGVTGIRPGKHDHDAEANPLPDYFYATDREELIPKVAL